MTATAEETAREIAEPSLDFLDAKADAWMLETQMVEMFGSIAAVFEPYASAEQMDLFREQLNALAHLCFVEGAYRAWLEIKDEAAAHGAAERALAIEECATYLDRRANEMGNGDSSTAQMMGRIWRDEAAAIRALARVAPPEADGGEKPNITMPMCLGPIDE